MSSNVSRARLLLLTVIVRSVLGRVHPFIIDDVRQSTSNAIFANANASDYDFHGSLLMHSGSLESFRSKVIVNYLATCTKISLDLEESCIVPTFLNSTAFNSSFFESMCDAQPEYAMDTLERVYYSAHQDCITNDQQDTEETVTNLRNVVDSGHCWQTFCEHDDITLDIESGWMETCAGIHLPDPTHDSSEEDFSPDRHHHNTVLACMLHFVMTSSMSEFGGPGGSFVSNSTCYRSDIDYIASLCPSSVGHAALEKCYTASHHHEDNEMSFHYQDSMSYDYGPPDNEEEEMSQYVEELCSLMTSLSSDVGKECLDSLCDIDTHDDSSQAPSVTPTNVFVTSPPTTHPPTHVDSATPSAIPTTEPTHSEAQAIIDVVFTSSFTFSKSATSVPINQEELHLFVMVLENSITQTLSNVLGNTSIKTRIDALNDIVLGHYISRRRDVRDLEETITISDPFNKVKFSVLASQDCFYEDCTNNEKSVNQLLDDYQNVLDESVNSGLMERLIRQEATLKESTQLKNAVVHLGSYSFISHASNVRLPMDEENDDFVPSQDSYLDESSKSPESSSTMVLTGKSKFVMVSTIIVGYVVTILIVPVALLQL